MLAPLAHNGGWTQTHAVLPFSPALDAGDPAAMAGQNGVPQFDQRGTPFGRVEDGIGDFAARIDIGAFEAPFTYAACDLNTDSSCDIDDLDLLYMELGGTDPVFNLDGAGVVNNDDVTVWLQLASVWDPVGRTFVRGDADLNGSVLGNDFTTLAFHFGGPGGWAEGNFVVDPIPGGGNVDGPDFTVLAFNFGFTSIASPVSSSEVEGADIASVIDFALPLRRQPAEMRSVSKLAAELVFADNSSRDRSAGEIQHLPWHKVDPAVLLASLEQLEELRRRLG